MVGHQKARPDEMLGPVFGEGGKGWQAEFYQLGLKKQEQEHALSTHA